MLIPRSRPLTSPIPGTDRAGVDSVIRGTLNGTPCPWGDCGIGLGVTLLAVPSTGCTFGSDAPPLMNTPRRLCTSLRSDSGLLVCASGWASLVRRSSFPTELGDGVSSSMTESSSTES